MTKQKNRAWLRRLRAAGFPEKDMPPTTQYFRAHFLNADGLRVFNREISTATHRTARRVKRHMQGASCRANRRA